MKGLSPYKSVEFKHDGMMPLEEKLAEEELSSSQKSEFIDTDADN